jgi:hypothetical protein
MATKLILTDINQRKDDDYVEWNVEEEGGARNWHGRLATVGMQSVRRQHTLSTK